MLNGNNNNYERRKTENINVRYDTGDDNYEMHNEENSKQEKDNNLMRRHSDMINNNNTTLLGLNTGMPMGLDLNSFINNDCDQTIHNISTSNDLPIISEVYKFK